MTSEATTSEAMTSEPRAADETTLAEEPVTPDLTDAPATTSKRRPTKFMVELSRAMQAAVETSHGEAMARLGADAKTVVEEIHAASAVEAAGLRQRADDDVAAVREWSKAEIARIREETEARVALRKTALDGEMDQQVAVIEARVQQVGATVAEFEALMAAYFVRLRAEEDPTHIAAMAEAMPDAPDLAGVAASITEPSVEPVDPVTPAIAAEPEVAAEPAVEADVTDVAAATDPLDPSGPDFAAAEAEAAAFTGDLDDEGEGLVTAPAVVDEAAAARLAATADESPPQGEHSTTRVVVLGLVSVASIATFKRSLGRVPGVSTIGVASGPDGEFVFTVSHDAGIGLGNAITALPGFEARITAETAGGFQVAAHDPDAGA